MRGRTDGAGAMLWLTAGVPRSGNEGRFDAGASERGATRSWGHLFGVRSEFWI